MGFVCRDDEVRDDGNGFDFFCLGEFDVVVNVVWWFWWLFVSVFIFCWGRKYFIERNFCVGGIFRG